MLEGKEIQQIIGSRLRSLREDKARTLQDVALAAGISYQYLSTLENGQENATLAVLERLSLALGIGFRELMVSAFAAEPSSQAPRVMAEWFRPGVPLPPGMTVTHLSAALDRTSGVLHDINKSLLLTAGKPLRQFVQGNNFSGIVSNILMDSLHAYSPYKHNGERAYPDLANPAPARPTGLEVKTTINAGKGGESHNGHGGWHMVTCYRLMESGDIQFIHIMFANLNGHRHKQPDWTYLGSKVNRDTGSQRTETYVTNKYGTTKLRDGSIYLDADAVDFSHWRQGRRTDSIPPFSIFSALRAPNGSESNS